jgi:non-specific serine/threonine protein kinase
VRTAAELDAGTLVAGYRIDELVGRGGMGVVYRATQLALNRPVALKLIAPELAREAGFRERFEREAKVAASLEHAHVLPVHEAGEAGGLLFLSMRYVEGRDLGSLLADEGALAPARAATLVAQVAAALDAAHARGLVHRDVKPQNVLVERRDGGEHAYLCDFGLTRAAGGSGLTATGGFLGTVDYAAPEQIRGEPVDGRSDVYALGCLLFQTLTGRVPYPREDELATLWAHLHEPPPGPSALRPELAAFDSVVARALAKQPDQRYQAAGELARAALAAAEGKVERTPPRPSSLPRPPTSLVGRRRELAELQSLLARPEVRLLTLTGAGGTGKTRLALALAEELAPSFGDGMVFCELASISDPTFVLPTVAQALGLRETGGEPLLARLKGFLRERELLLCLDSVEQVVEVGPDLAELLAAAPAMKLLVTSRERLHLQAEHEYPVEPLALPDAKAAPDPEALAQVEAVALFLERAQAVKPDFCLTGENAPAVAAISRRLDGLPLALELAASRTKLLAPEAMLGRLEHGLELLTGGPRDLPARQQTLRATIEWSYEFLAEADKRIFARLAVFVDGCTLEAAEKVCEAELDTLASLIDKSLLREREDARGEPRFSMLETVREYALERLEEGGKAEAVRRRHAQYFLALAEEAEQELRGRRAAAWIDRLEDELGNLRAVLGSSIAAGEADLTLRLLSALALFWKAHGHVSEARQRLAEALTTSTSATVVRAKALWAAGYLAYAQSAFGTSETLLEESAQLSQELDERDVLILALADLGMTAALVGDHERAKSATERSVTLARERGEGWLLCHALLRLAFALGEEEKAGYLDREEALLEECIAAARVAGFMPRLAQALNNLGCNSLIRNDLERAVALLEESLAVASELGDIGDRDLALGNLGWAALLLQDGPRAAALFADALTMADRLGNERSVPEGVQGLAAVAVAEGRALRAARLYGAGSALHEAVGVPPWRVERAVQEQDERRLREKLGDPAFDAAWTEGQAMTRERAIAEALAFDSFP